MPKAAKKSGTVAVEGTATETVETPKGDMAEEAKETGKKKSLTISDLKAKTDAGTKAIQEAFGNIAKGLKALATSKEAKAFAELCAVNSAKSSEHLHELADTLETSLAKGRKAIVNTVKLGLPGDAQEVTRSEQVTITKGFRVATDPLPIAVRIKQEYDGGNYPATVLVTRDATGELAGFMAEDGQPTNMKGEPIEGDAPTFEAHEFYLNAAYDLLPKAGKKPTSKWSKFIKLLAEFGTVEKLPGDITLDSIDDIRANLTHIANLLPVMVTPGMGAPVAPKQEQAVEAVVTQ